MLVDFNDFYFCKIRQDWKGSVNYLYDRFEGIFKIVIWRISVHDKEPVGKSDDQHEKVDETFSKMSCDVVKHDTYSSS